MMSQEQNVLLSTNGHELVNDPDQLGGEIPKITDNSQLSSFYNSNVITPKHYPQIEITPAELQ